MKYLTTRRLSFEISRAREDSRDRSRSETDRLLQSRALSMDREFLPRDYSCEARIERENFRIAEFRRCNSSAETSPRFDGESLNPRASRASWQLVRVYRAFILRTSNRHQRLTGEGERRSISHRDFRSLKRRIAYGAPEKRNFSCRITAGRTARAREREMAREAFYENGSRVALDIDISLLANGYRTEERRLNE